MLTEQALTPLDKLLQLISDMSFSVGLANGLQASGLAVLLLALVAVVFIRSKPFRDGKLADLIHAVRPNKNIPPAE